jgi:RNA polymerase sigma factor (sigma-70 family)
LSIVDWPVDPGFLARLRVRLAEYASYKGVGNRAEDVVQETLLVLWSKYPHLEDEIEITRVSYGICRLKILEALRVRQSDPLPEDMPILDPRPGVEARLQESERGRRLRASIAQLCERCQHLFKLRLLEKSTREISALMRAPEADPCLGASLPQAAARRARTARQACVRTAMDDAEFSRLVQAHMFGATTPQERHRLIAAALESSERAIEFASVEEIRDALEDPALRRSLIASLPDIETARSAWWQQWLRPIFLVPLAGGAAVVLVLLAVADSGSRQRPPEMAQGPSTSIATPNTAPGPEPGVVPAGVDDPSTEELESLFSLPASRAIDLELTLDEPARRQPMDIVVASIVLAAEGRIFAFVRGPDGHLREVYPSDSAPDDSIQAGALKFSFQAAGRLDPPGGGRSTLRVFIVAGQDVAPAGPARVSWLAERARFDEVTYETAAP